MFSKRSPGTIRDALETYIKDMHLPLENSAYFGDGDGVNLNLESIRIIWEEMQLKNGVVLNSKINEDMTVSVPVCSFKLENLYYQPDEYVVDSHGM